MFLRRCADCVSLGVFWQNVQRTSNLDLPVESKGLSAIPRCDYTKKIVPLQSFINAQIIETAMTFALYHLLVTKVPQAIFDTVYVNQKWVK